MTNHNLPPLPQPWRWLRRSDNNRPAACLYTTSIDCMVSIADGSLTISTGWAPVEVVRAVLEANG
jgi:hypothetical protein